MTKENWLSIGRSTLTFVGFFIIGHVVIGHTVDANIFETVAGIAIAGLGIVLGIRDKSTTKEAWASFFRSTIIGVSAIGTAWGYLSAETARAIESFVGAIMTVILAQTNASSIKDVANGKAAPEVDKNDKPTGKLGVSAVPPSNVPKVMAKKAVMILFLALLSGACSAQFFKPLPKPTAKVQPHNPMYEMDSAIVVLPTKTAQNNIRPVVGVTALISDGTQLAGGFGVGFQHNVWDDAAQAWTTPYSVSAIGFLGSNTGAATFTAGLVVGFLSFVSIGYGYDFTAQRGVVITGVQLHFN